MKALLGLCEEKEFVATNWQPALSQFVEKYGTQFDLASAWTAAEKTTVLNTMLQLFRAGKLPMSLLVQALTAIKIITRSKSSLDPLYSKENVKAFFSFIEREDLPAPVRVEALRVLLNMVIINEASVSTAVLSDDGKFEGLVRLVKESDPESRFVASRLLFFFAINDACIPELTNSKLPQVLSSIVVQEADTEQKYAKFCEASAEGTQRRRLVSSCVKVLFNFLMDSKRPRLEASISESEFDTFGKCLCGLMQLGVTTKEPWERGNNQVEVVHASDSENKDTNAQKTGRYVLKFDAAQMVSDPNAPTQLEVQLDIANLLMYLPHHMVQFATDWKPLQGLATLLDYQAYACTLGPKTAREQLLVPILSTLTGIVRESPDARLYFKRYIFGNLYKPADDQQEKSAEQLGMESEGPKLDTEVGTLREILLRCIISLQMTLKLVVSEFLYELCEKDTHEYIRLTGFGNAVGLLAEKGLPGFAGLKQQAHNIDDVLKSGKKL